MRPLFLFLLLLPLTVVAQQVQRAVQTHFGQIYRDDITVESVNSMLDWVEHSGFTMIRDECYWSIVETEKGVFSFPAEIDHYISSAEERGLDVLLILNYNNPLYAAHAGTGISSSENLEAYLAYVRKTVEHYSAMGVDHYEIWNEPNIPIFWDTTPSVNDYAQLVRETYPAITEINPDATVLVGATSPAEGDPEPSISWLNFFQGIKFAGLGNNYDGISFHLYRVDRGPEQWLAEDIAAIQELFPNAPLYITETGYHTAEAWPNISEQEKAARAARLYLLAEQYSQLRAIVTYDLKDDCTDNKNPECRYGLLNYQLGEKAPARSLKALFKETGGKSLSASTVENERWHFMFTGSSETTHAIWSTGASGSLALEVASEHLRVTTSANETSYFYLPDKVIDVPYSASPRYITELNALPEFTSSFFAPASPQLVEGQTMQFVFMPVTENGEQLNVLPAYVNWSIEGNAGSITSDGRLTAEAAGTVTIRAEFQGIAGEQEITIIPAYNERNIEEYENGDSFEFELFNVDSSTQYSFVSSPSTSAESALQIDYKFTFIFFTDHRMYFHSDYPVYGEPDSVKLDVYNNGHGHGIVFTFVDAEGFTHTTAPVTLPLIDGWTTAAAPVGGGQREVHYPLTLTKLTFYLVSEDAAYGQEYEGTVVLDNLRLTDDTPVSIRPLSPATLTEFRLHNNYPNPFNPETVITFQLAEPADTQLLVYSLQGRLLTTLIDERLPAGSHRAVFDASRIPGVASGVYIYQLHSGRFSAAGKMVYLK